MCTVAVQSAFEVPVRAEEVVTAVRKEGDEVRAYFASAECTEQLERAWVSNCLVETWTSQEKAPAGKATMQLQALRTFYMHFCLRNAGQMATRETQDQSTNEAYKLWSKCCLLLDAVVQALDEAKSELLEDAVLVGVVVIGLSFKMESQYAAARDVDLLQLVHQLEATVGLPVRDDREAADLQQAERLILKYLGWNIPQMDPYSCMETLLVRANIVSKGRVSGVLRTAGQEALKLLVPAICRGQPLPGYALARQCLLVAGGSMAGLAHAEEQCLKLALELAAPEPCA